jgi:hypothetical protein
MAESQRPAPTPPKSSQQQKAQPSEPVVVSIKDPITIEKSDEDRNAERQESEHKVSTDRKLIFWTGVLATATLVLSGITGVLAKYTYNLWNEAKATSERQGREMQESLSIARGAAEAAISEAAPYLYPRVIEWSLYPDKVGDEDALHIPRIGLAFENIGRTPAIMSRVGVRLELIEDETNLPVPPPLGVIPSEERNDAVPAGELSKESGTWAFARSINAAEIRKLLANTKGPYLRFYIYGFVIYEDVFNARTTARFCMKLRTNWQVIRGGADFNTRKREKNPASDPIGTPDERS